ncbi:MAG: lytic transglycosylase domain-containing protein [Bacteroidales bacterium]|nr:lytic transglycosylase domain-containing protein [Bacteroidales bacterium]
MKEIDLVVISRRVLVPFILIVFALGYDLCMFIHREPIVVEIPVQVPVKVPVPTPAPADTLTDWQQLQLAIAYTESRCNPAAVGKAQDSGILQLTPIYIAETNRVAGTDYALADAFDISKAFEIFGTLQDHYNPTHDLEAGIYYHNKASHYRTAVLRNLEFIKRYEAARAQLKEASK